MGKGKKARPHKNRGAFRRGPDARRHVFTRGERQRGFAVTALRVLAGELSQRWLCGRIKTTCALAWK